MSGSRDMKALPDESIIELYFERDEKAIFWTDRKYRGYLLTIAYNILGNSQDSEECLNDTYLSAWNSIPPTRPQSLKAFVAKLMRSKAVNRYEEITSQKRVPAAMCEPLSELEGLVAYVDGAEYDEKARDIGRIVSAYLEGLPDRALYIFIARYFYARRLEVIADRLDVSLSTVNKELAAMKKGLRKKLEEGGFKI